MNEYPRYVSVRVDTSEQQAAVTTLFSARFWFEYDGDAWVGDNASQSWESLFDFAWNGERPHQPD